MKTLKYTWKQFALDIKALRKLKDKFTLTGVYGIPRGGLVPAVCLSHALKIPLILDPKDITQLTLVVDDVSDSGKRLNELFSKLRYRNINPKSVTLFIKKGTSFMPDAYIRIAENTEWILYPWENPSRK